MDQLTQAWVSEMRELYTSGVQAWSFNWDQNCLVNP